MSDNHIAFTYPKHMALPRAKVSFAVADKPNADGSVAVSVSADKFALFVTLTTLAQGRFSDNAFPMRPGTLQLTFIPVTGFELAELKATIRVEHAATYM